MRYCIKFHPNPDCMTVHLDVKIVERIVMFHCPDWNQKKQSRLVCDLFATEGIKTVTLSPYEISLVKGNVFDWKEIISAILFCIQNNLDPKGELIEARPVQYSKSVKPPAPMRNPSEM